MRITMISFSNWDNGNCRNISKLAAEAYAGNEVKIFCRLRKGTGQPFFMFSDCLQLLP